MIQLPSHSSSAPAGTWALRLLPWPTSSFPITSLSPVDSLRRGTSCSIPSGEASSLRRAVSGVRTSDSLLPLLVHEPHSLAPHGRSPVPIRQTKDELSPHVVAEG